MFVFLATVNHISMLQYFGAVSSLPMMRKLLHGRMRKKKAKSFQRNEAMPDGAAGGFRQVQ